MHRVRASMPSAGAGHRSEEHTSELQSHLNLVCRLLLAKFVDAENALDPTRAETMCRTINDLLVSQPVTGEHALEIVEFFFRSGAVALVFVHSPAAPLPR